LAARQLLSKIWEAALPAILPAALSAVLLAALQEVVPTESPY
jgi:hypothetical protein